MKRTLTKEEFEVMFGVLPEDCEEDNEGQLVIYTGYRRCDDSSYDVVEIGDELDCN